MNWSKAKTMKRLGKDWKEKYDLKERNRLLRIFVKAMHKPSMPDHVIMRVKGKDDFSLLNPNQTDVGEACQD